MSAWSSLNSISAAVRCRRTAAAFGARYRFALRRAPEAAEVRDMPSWRRILRTDVGRVLLAAAAALTAIGAAEAMQSVVAAAAFAGFGVVWIKVGTHDQRVASRVSTLGLETPHREQAFAARADVTVLMGFGWVLSGWIGLVVAALAATG